MAHKIIISLAVLSNIVWLFLAYVRPFLFVLKTGRFLKGFFMSWSHNFLFSIAISILIPSAIALFLRDQNLDVYDYFPDGPAIAAVLFLGWGPALIFCGIAYGIHVLKKKRRASKATQKLSEA